jgi:hypothetical protein
MNKFTLTTYMTNETTDLFIDATNCEITFNACYKGEAVNFEDLSRETVNQAIHSYIVNAPRFMSKEQLSIWLRTLHEASSSAIKAYETMEESK